MFETSSSSDIERCGFLFVHEDTVQKVMSAMPKDETLYDLAELFKVFGDSTRIRILYALFVYATLHNFSALARRLFLINFVF